MMHRRALLWVVVGGGSAWAVHLFAGYFLVSLGCARHWPALGAALGGVTVLCATGTVALTVGAWRWRRHTRGPANETETPRLLLTVAILLGLLFTIMIVLGGLTVAVLPPCQTAIAGSP
jgi:heme/copper-type cytochrome/quinol oxidase subunit 3